MCGGYSSYRSERSNAHLQFFSFSFPSLRPTDTFRLRGERNCYECHTLSYTKRDCLRLVNGLLCSTPTQWMYVYNARARCAFVWIGNQIVALARWFACFGDVVTLNANPLANCFSRIPLAFSRLCDGGSMLPQWTRKFWKQNGHFSGTAMQATKYDSFVIFCPISWISNFLFRKKYFSFFSCQHRS